MENNQKDFLKNRPVVASLNQVKDVYGSYKRPTLNILTFILSLVTGGLTLYFYLGGSVVFGSVFLVAFVALVVSTIVSYVSDRRQLPVEKVDSSEAIFKEYDE